MTADHSRPDDPPRRAATGGDVAEHDCPSAAAYLADEVTVRRLVTQLRKADRAHRKAAGILRTAAFPLCAGYLTDETTAIPRRIVALEPGR